MGSFVTVRAEFGIRDPIDDHEYEQETSSGPGDPASHVPLKERGEDGKLKEYND